MAQQNTSGFTVEVVMASTMIDSSVMVWPYGHEPGLVDEQPTESTSEVRANISDQEMPQPTQVEVPIVVVAADKQPTEPTNGAAVEPVVTSTTSDNKGRVATPCKKPGEGDEKYREDKAEIEALAAAGDINGLERREQELLEKQHAHKSREAKMSGAEWDRVYALIGDIRVLKVSTRKRREELDADQVKCLNAMADEAIASGDYRAMIAVLRRMNSKAFSDAVRRGVQDKRTEVQQELSKVNVHNVRAALQEMAEKARRDVAAALYNDRFVAADAALTRAREVYRVYLLDKRLQESFCKAREEDAWFEDPWDVFEELEKDVEKARADKQARCFDEVTKLQKMLQAAINSGNSGAAKVHASRLQELGVKVDIEDCMNQACLVRQSQVTRAKSGKCRRGEVDERKKDPKLSKRDRKLAVAGR